MLRAGVAVAAVLVSCTALTAGAATGPAQIRITDVEVAHHAAPAVAGNIETYSAQLYNPSISRKPIGTAAVTCTWVDSHNRSCLSTYVLPKGSIVAAGAIRSRIVYELPVVGGTGLYDNARGTLTVTASHFRPRHEVLVFRLVG